MAQVTVPDIGDLESVEVIELCVAPGDEVGPDDPIVVVESDKASMEIPAGAAGIVQEVLVEVGAAVTEGQAIAQLQVQDQEDAQADSGAPAGEDARPAPEDPAPPAPLADPSPVGHAAPSAQAAPLASQGAGTLAEDGGGTASEEDDSDKASQGADAFAEDGGGTASEEDDSDRASQGVGALGEDGVRPASEVLASEAPAFETLAPARPPGSGVAAEPSPGAQIYAGPATRRLARELGVQLAEVPATGARGRILKDDVKRFVKAAMSRAAAIPGEGAAGIPPIPEADFSRFGPVQVLPLGRVRALGARNLHRSWLNLPHVTQHEEADLTDLEAFRHSLKGEAQRRGLKLTPLPFVIHAVCRALKAFPSFNASLDAAAQNYLIKGYYRIGCAVDTEQGLVVPVLKDAERKGIWALCAELAELAAKARSQKLGMDDMQGGTFTVSSLGAAGGTGFTPIINAPEVAILGVARLAAKPVWDGAQFQPRQMLPLSLSYDHRAINGAEAGRFLMHLAGLLQEADRFEL